MTNFLLIYLGCLVVFGSLWVFKFKRHNGGRNFLGVLMVLLGITDVTLVGSQQYQAALAQNVHSVVNQRQEILRSAPLTLANHTLSSDNPQKIMQFYNAAGQQTINSLYGNNTTSKNYALTLIGKKIPVFTLYDTHKDAFTITNHTILVILNNGDKCKDFINNMNNVKFNGNIQYLAVFPVNTNHEASQFCSQNKLNNHWKIITESNNPSTALHPDLKTIATNYFNTTGVPAYVALNHQKITLAGTGTIDNDSFQHFCNEAFKTPYIYQMTKLQQHD